MAYFFAFMIGFMHHFLPTDTPGGMVSCVSEPTAVVTSIV
jgi:hypothetical protein